MTSSRRDGPVARPAAAEIKGSRPTLVFRDAGNRVYLLRFDPPEAPELATGAEMISSRFFHALGYYVPETYLVVFDREQLVVETNASDVTSSERCAHHWCPRTSTVSWPMSRGEPTGATGPSRSGCRRTASR